MTTATNPLKVACSWMLAATASNSDVLAMDGKRASRLILPVLCFLHHSGSVDLSSRLGAPSEHMGVALPLDPDT